MKAIRMMSKEHRYINNVIRSLQEDLLLIEKRNTVDEEKLSKVIQFLRIYADKRHHHREEQGLFPALIRNQVPPGGCPVGGLNNQHEKGRNLITQLEEQLKQDLSSDAVKKEILSTIQEIAALYKHHLWMEEEMVFPMASKLLKREDNREMLRKFKEIDQEIGKEEITKWEHFAQSLSPY